VQSHSGERSGAGCHHAVASIVRRSAGQRQQEPGERSSTKGNQLVKKTPKRTSAKRRGSAFGGRATAVGVGYEAQVAASIASKMLAGDSCIVWEGINGEDVAAITMQDAEPVDDVVVTLRGQLQAKVFISAKHRSGTIALTATSPAFSEVIDSFVRQFHLLTSAQRTGSRLMWAVPSSAGAGMTQVLRKALDAFRADASAGVKDFLRRRATKEQEAIKVLVVQTKRYWKSANKKVPNEVELGEFMRMIHVAVFDFGLGLHHEQYAEETIRRSMAVKPSQSREIWDKLDLHFRRADQRGLRTTAASLRQMLTSDGLKLKPTPGFAEDIELLRRLTARNLDRLKDHTLLRFAKCEIHISRTEELVAMTAAAKRGHLLVTGDPGCGKSGLIHPLAQTLSKEGIPIVLLLAEEVFGRDWKGAANLPGLAHSLDDVLAHWPDGVKGVLITDALDAVRDVEVQRALRRLLQDVQQGTSGWAVVASVREFDLKHGRELREAFPGDGVVGHCSGEFTGVSHFHVAGLAETKLDELAAKVAEICPFIVSARKNPRAGGIHRSPFFLRLAAELLKDGVSPARLADWSSPAILLRRFWKARVMDGTGANHRKVALQSICRRMTQLRSMALSMQEVSLDASELDATEDLRSRGIFQSPVLRHGSPAGEDELRFSHHLLHDYAIARSLIPPGSERFADFAVREPLLPIFYRQSFLFALEELWDGPLGRDGFWKCALKMESVAQLHGVTRILAPILAARRVDILADLNPLLAAVQGATSENSPAEKALRHMASGLQDADDAAIRAGAGAWCAFATKLSALLPGRPSLEAPLVHILARLNGVSSTFDTDQLRNLNSAARGVLGHHIAKEVSRGWRYAALTSIETVCRTFKVAIPENEAALRSLLTPQRLAQFPHLDLFDFAHQLKHLASEGDAVVLSLFDAAFSTEPTSGEWENFGGAIMPMRMQSSDNWNSIHYSLAGYYASRTGANAGLMTDIACIAWNSAVRRRSERHESGKNVLATVRFRGVECELIEDCGHIWGREHEHKESRILSHFETLLDGWATTADAERLPLALDRFAARNSTSLLWKVFMEAGAKHPAALGRELEPVLAEPLFLTHPDYCYGGTLLLAALHKTGDSPQRERLEALILGLPQTARLRRDEPREPMPSWVEYAQNKLLGALDESHIVSPAVRTLRIQRAKQSPLPVNREPGGTRVTSSTFSDEGLLERRSVSLKDPVNEKLLRLREALKPFREQDGGKFTVSTIEQHWTVIGQCELAIRRHRPKHRKMADELWGHLVSACESIVRRADWPAPNERWKVVRRILLKASNDTSPQASSKDDSKEDQWPSWDSPAPRLDAARGLLFLVYRLGRADKQTTAALLRLSQDKSHPLRFNMADQLAVLEQAEPKLMWQLIDRFIRYERKFSVLEMVVNSLNRLWARAAPEVKLRLSRIAQRTIRSAPDGNHIHETLARAHLFHFLRTGDADCEAFVNTLIAECDRQRASHALTAQLHTCRSGRWLTDGDGVKIVTDEETARKRTWGFFGKLLAAAQAKLQQHRDRWQLLHAAGQPTDDEVKTTQEAIKRTSQLVDGIAMQLYFASGAFADKQNKEDDHLTEPQKKRFWTESANLFHALAAEIHPHTAHYLVQALHHLLPCSPREVFLTAARTITSSSTVGYQHESLAVGDVVKLIQRALADHRDIFQTTDGKESDSLAALLKVLDLFVEVGWAEARQLTHRLEEIYR